MTRHPELAALAAGEPATFQVRGIRAVDPFEGRQGLLDLRVEEGRIDEATWTDEDGGRTGATATGSPSDERLLVVPALLDLDATVDRDPDIDDGEGETAASLDSAAAHGGFATVCVRGSLATWTPGALRLLAPPGERLASVPPAGALLAALLRAGADGRVVVVVADDAALSAGSEASEGTVATILGLRPAPDAAEVGAVERALEVLRRAVAVAPAGSSPRLHLSRVSLGASVERIRAARAAGLPVTADACAHHLALHDGWLGGDRRFAWDAVADPWRGPATADAYDVRVRLRPPLRSPADALAIAGGVEDGAIDALVSGHEPRRPWQVEVEFGDAAAGASTIETSLPIALEAVRAGVVSLEAVIRAFTAGPAALLGEQHRGIVAGQAAYLTIVDRDAEWTPGRDPLCSADQATPLSRVPLRGQVVVTVVKGLVAFRHGPERG